MEQGRLVEHGTHRELLAAAGVYARMWALQQEQQEHGAKTADVDSALRAHN